MKKVLFILLFISAFAKAQDNYIVLSQDQKDFLDTFKLNFTNCLQANRIDFNPIPIKDSLYILPISLLQEENFSCIYNALRDRGSLDRMIIRRVEEDEFIKYDENGNIIE